MCWPSLLCVSFWCSFIVSHTFGKIMFFLWFELEWFVRSCHHPLRWQTSEPFQICLSRVDPAVQVPCLEPWRFFWMLLESWPLSFDHAYCDLCQQSLFQNCASDFESWEVHIQRAAPDTFDLWDIWSEWWGDMAWQWQRHLENTQRAVLETCDLRLDTWDTDYISDNWEL